MGTLRGAGAATVGRELTAELLRAAPDGMVLWLPSEWGPGVPSSGDADVRLNSVPGIPGKFYLENVVIRRAIRRGEIDRLFSAGDTGPLHCSVPHLLLVQQAFLAYPPSEWRVRDSRLRLRMMTMAAYFRLGMRTVAHYTVQTETMRHRLAE